ncbi:MAG: diguanylate cyclase [Acidobacteriia bacterium]|nr:diguanylate cyclase [Terriglobia bacterium]
MDIPEVTQTLAFSQLMLEQVFDGVYILDTEGRITYWNKAAERITGYTADEVVGRRCRDEIVIHTNWEGCQMCQGDCPAHSTLGDGVIREAEVFLKHSLGHRVPVRLRVAPVYGPEGTILGVVEVFTENSTKMALLEQLAESERLALIDTLTGVGNRRYSDLTLAKCFDSFGRYGEPFGVLFIDIDHFKALNDQYGHKAGDAVLRLVARTLVNAVRSFDFVGRWGGDEFLILAPKTTLVSLENLAERSRKLVKSCKLAMDSGTISPLISIGAALVKPGDTVDLLVDTADARLLMAKRLGRDRVVGKN